MSLFDGRNIKPMLIGEESQAFDDPAWLYELKLDGERAIVYLDKSGVELRNKRNRKMFPLFPELGDLHKQIIKPCILDGEYVVIKDGKPNFSEVQRRSLMSNPFKIKLAAQAFPVSFIAFDILYYDGRDLLGLPLMERKALLQKVVITESDRMAVSRMIEGKGVALYALAEQQGLEGIVAKRRDSLYWPGKRTKDWIKCKALLDDDFVVCGYIIKSDHMTSLVLGQYDGSTLVYKGHVTLGVSGSSFKRIQAQERLQAPLMAIPEGHNNEKAVWIAPMVCTVKFMERTANGGMRQPAFKGLREDKTPKECRVFIKKSGS